VIATILILPLTVTLASPVANSATHGSTNGASTASASPSAPPHARERTVALRIDHSALLQHESKKAVEHTVFFVSDDATKALGGVPNVSVVDDATAPAILVTLSWVDYEESIYGVSIETQRPGEAPRALERFECECINSGLSKAVVERLPAALEQLEAREPQPAEADPEAAERDPRSNVETVPVAQDPKDRNAVPLGVMGKAGIGLLCGGAVALVSGGIAFAVGERVDPPVGLMRDRSGLDYGPAGVALLVSGGAALVAGAALLAVDRTRARKRASALLLPSPGGAVITGRF
jgi:hypothetical protein